jgi:putative ABC transport system ATP-binding protein
MPQEPLKKSPPAFTTKGLTKTYGEGTAAVHALRGVDLEIPAGELVVLLGPSGSGKSTLLNIIGGLDRGTSGTAHFQDQELSTMTDAQLTRYRRDHVGFVFQFYNLMPNLTAQENVELETEIARDPMAPEAALDRAIQKSRSTEAALHTAQATIEMRDADLANAPPF